MRHLRKLLFAIWTIIYLIIPLTEFGYGVQYSQNKVRCPIVETIYPGLIGTAVCEGILLFGILSVVYLHYTNSGNTVHTDSTETYSNGKLIYTEKNSWTFRELAYGFTGLMILVSAGFFFALHQVYFVQDKLQFTNSSASTYCDQELYRAAYGLIIASYIVGFALLIFGLVIYKMKS